MALHAQQVKKKRTPKIIRTYKAILGKAPVYIQELLEMKSSSQTNYRLRSSRAQTLLKYLSGKIPLVTWHSCMLLPK